MARGTCQFVHRAASPQGPPGPRGPAGPGAKIVCRPGQLSAALCAIEFAPGTFTTKTANLRATFKVLRGGRTIVHGTITIRHGRVATRTVGRLRRGRYALVISVSRGRRVHVLFTRQFTVR